MTTLMPVLLALPQQLRRVPYWSSVLLLLLFGSVVFLLYCHAMFDADVWWHLRGGQWIVEHGWPPQTDPFTFGSQDRRWIDLHWLFQVILWLTFRAGGVAGIILLAATLATAAILVALVAHPLHAPLPVVLLCWLPALVVISFRSQPRPELFTLLFLAAYLTVLVHLDDHPRLVWLLPFIQLAWVNMHSLFVFGPIVLALRIVSQAGSLAWKHMRGELVWSPEVRRWWRHVLGASAAVAVVCLVNPYGLDGTLFPLDLYPKVTQAGNPYKEVIGEFFSPKRCIEIATPEAAGNSPHYICFYLLLLLLPLSFLLPAIWRASLDSSQSLDKIDFPSPMTSERTSLVWLGVLAGLFVLLAASTLTLSTKSRPAWVVSLGETVPLLLIVAAAGGSAFLARRSRRAAGLTLAAGVALAAWTFWVKGYLFGNDAGPSATSDHFLSATLVIAMVAGAVALPLTLRFGGNLFGILLAGAFGYLALKAMNNLGRFALVAGIFLSSNLALWVEQLLADRPVRSWHIRGAWTLRLVLACLLLGWSVAIVTDRYPHWVSRHFALRESPFHFAHDAVRFAGQPGMPEHALVYDMTSASLYVFHNAPGHKPFMDSRLEVPSLQTFQTYLSIERILNQRGPQGIEAVHALGDPLVLLTHGGHVNAEAALLAHPHWRLVYFDALAAVFLPRTDPNLEVHFPTLDLAARHFGRPRAPSVPASAHAAWNEGKALYNLSDALHDPPDANWTLRIPILLAALNRAEISVEEEPTQVGSWILLGDCHWSLIPELRSPPPPPVQEWDPDTGLAWAQVTYCFRQALEYAPDNPRALKALYRSYAVRQMIDAQRTVGERLLALGQLTSKQEVEVRRLARLLGPSRPLSVPLGRDVPIILAELLQVHRPEDAARVAEGALTRGEANWDWALADRVAGACMQLGRPALARQLWQKAKPPPSNALRESRLADTYWVERDFDAAIRHYGYARRLEPQLAQPYWALAWLYAQRGEADAALQACRDGLNLPLPDVLRTELEALEELLRVHAKPVHP